MAKKKKKKNKKDAGLSNEKIVSLLEHAEPLSDQFFQLQRQHHRNNNPKPSQKELKKMRAFVNQVMDGGYDKKGKRHGKTKKEMQGVITKENSSNSYTSQVAKYAYWAAKTYYITDFKALRPWMYDDYVRENIRNFENESEKAFQNGTAPPSPSVMLQQRFAVVKFEEIMGNYYEKQRGEKYDYRFIAKERMIGKDSVFSQHGITRDLSNISRNRPLIKEENNNGTVIFKADDENFFRIHSILKEENPEFAKLWLHQGMAGQRLDAAMNTRKEDIVTSGIDLGIRTEVGKAGKKYETNEVHPSYLRLLEEETENYRPGRLLFSPPEKKDGNDAKNSTFKTAYDKAIREAAMSIGLEGVTSHTARKFYAQSLYDKYEGMTAAEFKEAMNEKGEKYKEAFTKDRNDLNRKRLENSKAYQSIPKDKRPLGDQFQFYLRKEIAKDLAELKKAEENGYKYNPRFIHHNDDLTQERRSALIASVETGHSRISIMAHYIVRRVANKIMGENTWFNDTDWNKRQQQEETMEQNNVA